MFKSMFSEGRATRAASAPNKTVKSTVSSNSTYVKNAQEGSKNMEYEWSIVAQQLFLKQTAIIGGEEKKVSDLGPVDEKGPFSVPTKIDLYEGLDITEKDGIYINGLNLSPNHYYRDVLLVNGEDYVVGKFSLENNIIDGKKKWMLVAKSEDINFQNHSSSKYYFLMAVAEFKLYKIPINEVIYKKTEITNTHLCIDFGTSNTTAGCFLDNNYVDNISNIAEINNNIKLNDENITLFADKKKSTEIQDYEISYQKIVPTIVYVKDCRDRNNIKYLFGYEASEKMKEDQYCPKASCFMEIKRWTSDIEAEENIQDIYGNKATVTRREIISKYLMFIIRESENQYKCKFKNIHMSAPVKLKDKVLDVYESILQEQGYILEKTYAIDEGIAVLYNIIDTQIKEDNYENGREEKALIIDCGGGTSDLASCSYSIDKDEDGIINLDIATEYVNGDINFGGNNLTYKIMQYMKIVYAAYISEDKKRVNIDEIIPIDVNGLFSYIEGEMENDNPENIQKRYEEVYRKLNEEYSKAENIIPTRFGEYENQPKEIYDKIKNNFYFLWKLAEEMKKEFYRTTSISRYKFDEKDITNSEIDLHVKKIEDWRLSIQENGKMINQDCPDITFNAKEIDKLLRVDIYYLVRRFLNDLYENHILDTYNQIKLSGQSSKINIFMDSLKEFLPGKKIKSGRLHSEKSNAEELKLLCLKGAIKYLHSLEKSDIEINLANETKNIPITVYIKNDNAADREMFHEGDDWEQKAQKRRLTQSGKEIYLYMKNSNKEVCSPYKYNYENVKYKETKQDILIAMSQGRIDQPILDTLSQNKKYVFIYLNKEKWGFEILPLYKVKEKLYAGKSEFCSFEMDMLQKTFFDGRK